MKMDKASARQFRHRWQAVEEIQQRDSPGDSLELRWRKLNAVFGMGKGLGLAASERAEMDGYQRWAKIKEKLLPSPKA